jgi:hypothetical protein
VDQEGALPAWTGHQSHYSNPLSGNHDTACTQTSEFRDTSLINFFTLNYEI